MVLLANKVKIRFLRGATHAHAVVFAVLAYLQREKYHLFKQILKSVYNRVAIGSPAYRI